MEKIIEKIKKILALSSSSNENEAEVAMAKAQDLMARHNIAQVDVDAAGDAAETYKDEVMMYESKAAPEVKYIRDILTKFYFVEIYFSKTNEGTRVMIIGKKENIEVAKYIHNYLKREFRLLWEYFSCFNKCSGAKYKNTYYYGLWNGLINKLKRERNALKKECDANDRALMVIDRQLEKYYKEKHPRMTIKTDRINLIDDGVFNAGKDDGANINLRKGIGGQGGNNGVQLLK